MRVRAAFFDVDETLITIKSMFRFLAFAIEACGLARGIRPCEARAAIGNRPRRSAAGGQPGLFPAVRRRRRGSDGRAGRTLTRRRAPPAGVLQSGRAHPVPLACRRWSPHGARLGLFGACVDPIAELLDADVVLCSRTAVRNGRYTGEIAVPMIGEAKVAEVRCGFIIIDGCPAPTTMVKSISADMPIGENDMESRRDVVYHGQRHLTG
ncbi:MAG: haloacid dehalogenase-like hydrolase [Pseudonocardiaceae bacterium]